MSLENLQLACDMLCNPNNQHTWELVRDLDAFWTKNKILVKSKTANEMIPCECEEGDLEEIFTFKGKYFIQCRRSGRLIPVASERRFDWHFDGEVLARKLAVALDCREEAPVVLIPERLWKLPHMRHLLGGVSRDVYFAPNMAWNVAEIYAALPQGSTQAALLYGSSRFVQDVTFPCDRCFCLGDFITVTDGTLHIDIDALDCRLTVNRKDTARPKRKPSPGQHELADKILKLLREYHSSVEEIHRQDREYGRPQTDVPRLKLTAVADRVGSPKGTVSKLLSHASAYSHDLAIMWEMYGPLQRRSKACTKKGRFEHYNDAVGYDCWDDEEEDREL